MTVHWESAFWSIRSSVIKIWTKLTGSGMIGIFLVPFLVAENLTRRENFYIDAGEEMEVRVAPLYDFQLKKFQVICCC